MRDGGERTPSGTGALMKALDVLDVVAKNTSPLSVSQIALQVGLPRPTTHRILNALLQRDMVRRDDAREGFSLGYRLFELAHRAWSDVDLRGAAREAMDELQAISQEVVVLGVRKGAQFVCVDRRETGYSIRPVITVGYTEPLWCSALGMAIASDLWLADDDGGLRSEITDIFVDEEHADLFAQMSLNAARGYTVTLAEAAGSATVAAPVLNSLGRPIASIGVVGPTSRLSEERLHQLAPNLIAATRRTTSNAGNVVQSIAPQPRPKGKVSASVEVLAATRTLMGKTPVWHPRNGGELSFSDAFGPSLLVIRTNDGAVEVISRRKSEMLAGLTEDGDRVVANADGISLLSSRGEDQLLSKVPDTISRQRFNYAAPDRAGRLVLSVMDARGRTDCGGLFRLEHEGTVSTMSAPLTMWSGLDWSPNGRLLYCADTSRQQMLCFSYDDRTGGLSERTILATLPVDDGRPDGVAVDAAGAIWLALWDGWAIVRITPDGRMDRPVVLPVPRPVGLCFGGKDHRTLFITSARVRLSPEIDAEAPLSGAVFAMRVETEGLLKTAITLIR